MDALIEDFDSEQLKNDIPEFAIGDTLRISTRIVEGEKERVQVFQGTVIARKGHGLSETISLHRISYGEGMERVFYLNSPRITKIEIIRKGETRRSKLYHLRGKTGKAARIREKVGSKKGKLNAGSETREDEIDIEIMADANEPEPVETTVKE